MKLSKLLVVSSFSLVALAMPTVNAHRALREASAASSFIDTITAESVDASAIVVVSTEDGDLVDGGDSFDAPEVRPVAPNFRFGPRSEDKIHAPNNVPARDLAQHPLGNKFRGLEPESEAFTPTVAISTKQHGEWNTGHHSDFTPTVVGPRRHFKG
jgi:hypothetical protein